VEPYLDGLKKIAGKLKEQSARASSLVLQLLKQEVILMTSVCYMYCLFSQLAVMRCRHRRWYKPIWFTRSCKIRTQQQPSVRLLSRETL